MQKDRLKKDKMVPMRGDVPLGEKRYLTSGRRRFYRLLARAHNCVGRAQSIVNPILF